MFLSCGKKNAAGCCAKQLQKHRRMQVHFLYYSILNPKTRLRFHSPCPACGLLHPHEKSRAAAPKKTNARLLRARGMRATMIVTETVTIATEIANGEGTVQKDIEETKKMRVIHAAWQAFAQYGYRKTSMQDIASGAGVSKSVLFKYFQTKERLYQTAFCLAAEAIAAADAEAKANRAEGESVFDTMRKTVDARMRLFAESPYVYSFSYTAAYDTDPLVQALVRRELTHAGAGGGEEAAYRGIRSDIPPQKAKQMIFWISQGFLGEKLAQGLADPAVLQREYAEWIDLMERLMTQNGGSEDAE